MTNVQPPTQKNMRQQCRHLTNPVTHKMVINMEALYHSYRCCRKLNDRKSVSCTFGSSLLLRVLEKVAPTLAFTYPTAGAYITNATPVIKFKVTNNDSGVNPDTIVIKVDGTKVTTAFTKTTITGGYECSYTPGTALADGAHTISIEASDFDGNAATAKTVTFTIDTIPPTLSVTAPTDGLITNKSTVTVTGKTDDATSKPVTVTVNGTAVTVGTDGAFSRKMFHLPMVLIPITIIAKDKAGKTTTVTRTVTLDTVAPVIKSISLTPNPVDCGKTFVIAVEGNRLGGSMVAKSNRQSRWPRSYL